MQESITGSTTIDVTNGIVTATCETDLDGDTDTYYEAVVHCTVTDGYGNQVGYGQYIDTNGNLGYAQAVVSFPAVPGTYYTATGRHLAEMMLGDYDDPPPGQPIYYLDYYNFEYFEGNPEPVDPIVVWQGPGPPQQTKANTIITGNTQNNALDPVDTTALIKKGQTAFAAACDADFTKVIGSTYTKTKFFNSLLATTINQYPAGTPNIPSGHLGDDAFTDPNPPRSITLLPNFYGSPPPGYPTTDQSREFILVHEGIHHYTGWSDATIFAKFYNSGLRNPSGNAYTGDITTWLIAGCPKS